MANSIINFIGSTGEIGASSQYLNLQGTGIIVDAGLHPRRRDGKALPDFKLLTDRAVDALLLTHAHTDHIGGLPYLLRYQPQIKIYSSSGTADLAELMLADTVKLLKSESINEYQKEAILVSQPDTLEKIWLMIEKTKFNSDIFIRGRAGNEDVKVKFFSAGHILGASSVFLQCNDKKCIVTGDISFENQFVIAGAHTPRWRVDTLVIESTNAGVPVIPDYIIEKNRLGSYINQIVDKNGSILIPAFALGKTQEILRIIPELMIRSSIPNLPIYTAGLAVKISKVYDKYCYSREMIHQGFEISDIKQINIDYSEILTGKYFKEPSIVIVASGMVNKRTYSFKLAEQWLRYPNFGIAFIGFLDESTPGWALMNSPENIEFQWAGKKRIRKCKIGEFRFSSHSDLNSLLKFISDTLPARLFIVHGDQTASDNLAEQVYKLHPLIEIIRPEQSKDYNLFRKK